MISSKDKKILRDIAKQIMEIANLDIQKETVKKWKLLNDMKEVRPMVYIYQIPWWEIEKVEEELHLKTEDERTKHIERKFRQIIYLWKHVPMDMVVEPFYTVTKFIVQKPDFGIEVKRNIIPSKDNIGVPSSCYQSQIKNEKDIEKIKYPEVNPDYDAAEKEYIFACEIFDGIMPIKKVGIETFTFAPWDFLAMICTPDQILTDLIERPEFIHKLIDRLTDAYCFYLDQIEKLNLFSLGTGNYIVGNGGLGFTEQLPKPDYNPSHIRVCDIWAGGTSQIFGVVSPKMHEEFALKYEKKYLEKAGLVYYGCCDPLHNKVDIVHKHLPNLRKISMSPWADFKKGAENIANRFVFSFKPNPAFLATEGKWEKEGAMKQIKEVLEITKGKHLEIILKDISTVCYQPNRLWEWAEMVMDMVKEYE